MEKLTANQIKVLFALRNNYRLIRDISLGSNDGSFVPNELMGVSITKSLIRGLQARGYVALSLFYELQVPMLKIELTNFGKHFDLGGLNEEV